MDDVTLAMDTADDRARLNLVKELTTKVSFVADDLRKHLATGKGYSNKSEEQGINDFQQHFVTMNINGTKIVDHWQNPKDGTVYSLCLLDVKDVKNAITGLHELSKEMQKHIEHDMSHSLNELRQIQKQDGQNSN
ncbi:MAG: hypothetical protein ACYCOU_24715 [Sulfobacillus sp.]